MFSLSNQPVKNNYDIIKHLIKIKSPLWLIFDISSILNLMIFISKFIFMTFDQSGISIILKQVYLFDLTSHSDASIKYPFKNNICIVIYPCVKLKFSIHNLQTAFVCYHHHHVMIYEHLLHIVSFGQETVLFHTFSSYNKWFYHIV